MAVAGRFESTSARAEWTFWTSTDFKGLNLLYPMKDALRVGATLAEVSDALRDVFGVHQP